MSTELAWAAGFFDGEGTFYRRSRRSRKEFNIEVSQRDRRVLDRFNEAVGHGKVINRNGRGATKPHFMWVCYRREDVYSTVNKLWPYLGEVKKEQIIRATDDITGHGGSCGV